MKFSARKTWPEKSQNWDYVGEAESIDDFALMYASDKGLAVDTEFVVIEKAGADSDIQFFKVARVEPYAVSAATPRVDGGEGASASAEGGQFKEQSIGEVWHAMFGNVLFFGKVGGTAFLFFLAIIFAARWWFDAW
ncbi:hypothetical protein MARPU_13340 [Marichromatium purpuratum 984]|uniref:Uncharacterized protein n=1 Tax=Marichromatium purpuratum 984 TaxID=765910 RepID=W0E1J4_MARPU|nr:hypothetical protein [Marichromatium purpuratum]AHF04715.1 hypothetical protein MARPU_13340 [Marichromatium purpuratum 984]